MKLQDRNKGTAILSDCCESPFGYVRNGRVTVAVRHNGEIHMLVLYPEDLEKLASLSRECAKIATDRAA